jgi:hypothetical protein
MNWKRLFCFHGSIIFNRNIYGDHINHTNGKRSLWICERCGALVYQRDLVKYDYLPTEKIQLVKHRFKRFKKVTIPFLLPLEGTEPQKYMILYTNDRSAFTPDQERHTIEPYMDRRMRGK